MTINASQDLISLPPVTATGTFTPSGLSIAGRITIVPIDNLTWTPLPAVALPKRNSIALQNMSGQEIKINYDPTTVGYVGMVINNNGERGYDIQDSIVIYGKSAISACNITVEELS